MGSVKDLPPISSYNNVCYIFTNSLPETLVFHTISRKFTSLFYFVKNCCAILRSFSPASRFSRVPGSAFSDNCKRYTLGIIFSVVLSDVGTPILAFWDCGLAKNERIVAYTAARYLSAQIQLVVLLNTKVVSVEQWRARYVKALM